MRTSPAGRAAFLPTPEQELLLRAALLPGDAAARAWEAWKRDPRDALDAGSERLLPLVHRNLLRLGIDDSRLRASWRRALSGNEILLRAVRPLLRSLREAGIRTMLLKGAALLLAVYRDSGVRPMDDVDLLVAPERAAEAARVTLRNGWSPALPMPAPPRNPRSSAWHELLFRNRANAGLDLHWRVFVDSARSAEADGTLWSASTPIDLGDGVLTEMPGAADLLLHVCVHGARWSATPPIRWVADAMAILRDRPEAIDWPSVLRQAETRRFVLPLRDSLAYLCETFAAPVPAHVRHALRVVPTSRLERAEYELWLRPDPSLGAADAALLHTLRYLRLTEGLGGRHRFTAIPDHLRQLWRVDPADRLLPVALRKIWRRSRPATSRGRAG